jgi:hypothetical protein
MNEKQAALLKLPAKRVESILLELATIRRRANEGEKLSVPMVTLHLASGNTLVGWIIDLADDRHQPCIVMQAAGTGPRTPRLDVTYVDREGIEAITIHEASDIAHILSFGTIDAAPGAPAPTRAELISRAEELGRALSDAIGAPIAFEIAWEQMSEQKEAMYSLGEILGDTAAALKKIAEDGFGRAELARRVRRIRLESGDRARVIREDDLLRVITAITAGQKGRLDRVGLIVAIGAEI